MPTGTNAIATEQEAYQKLNEGSSNPNYSTTKLCTKSVALSIGANPDKLVSYPNNTLVRYSDIKLRESGGITFELFDTPSLNPTGYCLWGFNSQYMFSDLSNPDTTNEDIDSWLSGYWYEEAINNQIPGNVSINANYGDSIEVLVFFYKEDILRTDSGGWHMPSEFDIWYHTQDGSIMEGSNWYIGYTDNYVYAYTVGEWGIDVKSDLYIQMIF